MIEPPKLTVFLFVVTAHLAVLAFGFPSMSSTPEGSDRHQSASADLAVVENSSQPSGSVTDAENHKYGAGADHDHDHGDAARPAATRASANSSATHAGHQPDSDGPVDTVPTLEEHRRQHGHDDHQHDHDSEPELVDLERVAHNDSPTKVSESPTVDAGNQKPAPTQLAVVPKSPPGLKPLPVTTEQKKADVPARPTPVQMITAEKPGSKPSVTKPKLKPVAKPTTSPAATEAPRARPVANAPKPVAATTSNRAGSARMKNLRPIKKP